MKALLLSLVLVSSTLTALAEISEEQAMEKVKALPEFVQYAAGYKYTFDDNEPLSERGELPEAIKLPAWRLDVHTVVHDPVVDHLALWNRFIVDASGELYVWERLEDRMVTLADWRKACDELPVPRAWVGGSCGSPDKHLFIAWFDQDCPLPLGEMRSIVLQSDADPDESLFSYVGTSRSTLAAWNAKSTACVIANEVSWEKTLVWLIAKDDKGQWQSRQLQVLTALEAAYRHSLNGKDHPGFRAHVEKVEWLEGTQVRFVISANGQDPELSYAGTYQVSFDTAKPGAEPTTEKIGDE